MHFSVEPFVDFRTNEFVNAFENHHLPTWKKKFWEDVEAVRAGLSNAVGIYAFVICHGTSAKPWYVGKTSAKGGYKNEIFQNHKVGLYKQTIGKRGSAKMLFVPLLTRKDGKLSSNTSGASKAIEHVEKQLISLSLLRNQKLLNVKDTKLVSSIFVPGVIGTRRPGRPQNDAKTARAVFLGESS